MRKAIICSYLFLAFVCSSIHLNHASAPGAPPAYTKADAWKIGGDGRWDYVTTDADGKYLYVPRSTHVMILDTASGKPVADITGLEGVHGVALAPEAGRGFISDGKDGSVTIFDLKTNAALGKVKAADDADCIIFDPASGKILVFCGDAEKMIPISPDVDAASGKADAAVDLGGKPEYAVADGKGKVYVAMVEKDEVAVVDTKAMKVIAHYPTSDVKQPVGMSMDPQTGKLFVGCRGKKLLVMNAADGKVEASYAIGAGVDATAFHDGLAFASCGDGTLTIIRETTDAGSLAQEIVKTELGARTMAVNPKTGVVYLPTSDMGPAPAPTADHPHPRPTPVPGTFKIVVLTPVSAK